MKFTWLLFDADNTLLDFTSASHQAFQQNCKDFKIPYLPTTYPTYKKINIAAWTAFEQGQITAEKLRIQRMALFLEAIQRTDIDPQQFSGGYIDNMILKSEMYNGVRELLESLKKKYRLSIVTNGLKEAQRPRLTRLNLFSYFESVVVSDEIGVAKPAKAFFEYVYWTIPKPPPKSEILMIGDSLHSDIAGGNNFGVKTCWLNHGKKNETTIRPDFEIQDVHGLLKVLT